MSEQVTVRFVTKDAYEKYRIGDSPLLFQEVGKIRLKRGDQSPTGARELPQPFDFSINDQLIREPLSSHFEPRFVCGGCAYYRVHACVQSW